LRAVCYNTQHTHETKKDYVRNEGVKSLSYSATAVSPIAGGDSTAELEGEMDAPGALRHDAPALVSLDVREASERPVKERLVAKRGKLVTEYSQAGEAPNGTGFVITTAPAPALDATHLVVGRVVEGMDVVAAIQRLPFAK
jgi:cyclophilin family peptidyl-prolyl cis-trans isomerase